MGDESLSREHTLNFARHCTSLDKDFMGFDECFLKSVNRTYKYMSFRTRIYQFPVNDITVKLEVLKRLNGYKPFLFNFTVDFCKFLKGQKKSMPTKFFYDMFASYSNVIHNCPYDVGKFTFYIPKISKSFCLQHDFFVNKLPISHLNNMLTNVLPVPEGVYCIHTIYLSQGIARMDLKVYVDIR
ncbi:hypothetical protein KR026_011529 [Drosophila bipectinata]|nr:hypothetical protein KR026_011529 [Drosophila bipectinata]